MAFFVSFGLWTSGYLEFLELSAYDLFVAMRPKLIVEDQRITIIEISEADIQEIGSWPLTDEILAKSLHIILTGNPRAVGIDIYRDIEVPPGSDDLSRLFLDNPHLIGVMSLGEKPIKPLAAIEDTEQAAFSDILVDPGGIVRRGLLFLDDGETSYNSFAFRLASLYLQKERVLVQPDAAHPQFIRLNNSTIKPLEANDGGYIKADARGYQFLLDYLTTGKPFRTYGLADLLASKVPHEAIANRIVLIGVSAESVKDYFYTPFSRNFTRDQQMTGVVLHANIISQLLRFALADQKPVRYMTKGQKSLWLFFWSLIGGIVGSTIRSAARFCILMVAGLTVIICMCYIMFLYFWWIPLVPPMLSFCSANVALTAYFTGREKRERIFLMQLFSRHVSKEIAEMLWQQRAQFLDNGRLRCQKMTATILFTDLRGFTPMSEKMDPQDLLEWLNTYMEAMCGVIMAHGGVVDDYFGDAIKADFGVPLPREREKDIRVDAKSAVDCALSMEREMCRLNADWQLKGLPTMGMRVGIFTGLVVAGLVGSAARIKYTTIGDTVNIASRLESYDKHIGEESLCRILIGEATRLCLNSTYQTERIGEVSLKGKDLKITVHRVLGKDLHPSRGGPKEYKRK